MCTLPPGSSFHSMKTIAKYITKGNTEYSLILDNMDVPWILIVHDDGDIHNLMHLIPWMWHGHVTPN